jgi:hypothetical protein
VSFFLTHAGEVLGCWVGVVTGGTGGRLLADGELVFLGSEGKGKGCGVGFLGVVGEGAAEGSV